MNNLIKNYNIKYNTKVNEALFFYLFDSFKLNIDYKDVLFKNLIMKYNESIRIFNFIKKNGGENVI